MGQREHNSMKPMKVKQFDGRYEGGFGVDM